jgi:hypothetical protein
VSLAAKRPALPQSTDGAWTRKILKAHLLEDAHPGSGAGGGSIDAFVARDRTGKPVIWASHLEGVLRDACVRLQGEAAAATFFGRAGGPQQQAVFTSLYALTNPASRIWRSSARKRFDNRAPLDDSLRVIEYVPAGTDFAAKVELPTASVPTLERLVAEVEALGAHRAPGHGKVRLRLADAPLPPATVQPAGPRLRLLLESLDPVCIAATATAGNLIPSQPFVPGRTLLGAIAAWLIAEGRRDVAGLLVSGQVSVSDALPLPSRPDDLAQVQVLPAPLSLQSAKPPGVSGPVPWWALPPQPVTRVDRERQAGGGRLKRPEPDLFVSRAHPGAPWTAYRCPVHIRLHSGYPDRQQAAPSLFATEQIAENTLFLAEIRGQQDPMAQLAQALGPVLDQRRWLRLGRGGAPVRVTERHWDQGPKPEEAPTRAYLTLTSDLLVRDKWLRWRASADEATLAALPNWPRGVAVTPVIQEATTVHGFNGTSRLRRLPATAVRRGSVFVVENKAIGGSGGDTPAAADPQGLAALARMAAQANWLGEQTHAGFGRFRLDADLPGAPPALPTAPMPVAEPRIGDDADDAVAEPRIGDDADDAVAATTQNWFRAHVGLAGATGSTRRPSLSQWHDLATALADDPESALAARRTPTTAGLQSWAHPDARAVLDCLEQLPTAAERQRHAWFFVRWLAAEMRGRSS